jgi:arylsulfatase A-like enzyme
VALDARPWQGRYRVTAAEIEGLEHEPEPPDAKQLAAIVGLYDAGIRATDELLGRLIGVLARHGILDDSLLVVLSDHGEEFFEHGRTQHKQLYLHPNLHVPLLIKAPGLRPARVATTVELIDVLPTVLELLAVPAYDGAMGRSLVPLMHGAPRPAERGAYAEGLVWSANLRTLVTDRYQLLYDVRRHAAQIYVTDGARPDDDVAAREPAVAAALIDEITARMQAAAARRTRTPTRPTIDAATRRDLGALGYVE